ncbi:MAG TPA: hypothetical protein VL460_00700 [Caulobacteraceae bacterium]|jgi:hypothetical protein|nr:hypothetical protein [Caulobacteraceae bacterium]
MSLDAHSAHSGPAYSKSSNRGVLILGFVVAMAIVAGFGALVFMTS